MTGHSILIVEPMQKVPSTPAWICTKGGTRWIDSSQGIASQSIRTACDIKNKIRLVYTTNSIWPKSTVGAYDNAQEQRQKSIVDLVNTSVWETRRPQRPKAVTQGNHLLGRQAWNKSRQRQRRPKQKENHAGRQARETRRQLQTGAAQTGKHEDSLGDKVPQQQIGDSFAVEK